MNARRASRPHRPRRAQDRRDARSPSSSTSTAPAAPSSRPACRSSTTCSTRSRATAWSTSPSRRKGDLHIDAHHTVEDIGITLGQAFKAAVGDKKGIVRYGHAYVPLDEALSRVVIDLSGRPGLEFHVPFTRAMIGTFDVDLTHEFFQGFVNHALVTLHVDNLRGDNAHHQCETVFKAFARALRMACRADPRAAAIPSTKGTL